MKSRRNPQLQQFVAAVRDQAYRVGIDIPAELAIAAADYIEARLAAAAKGGARATRKKPGRPITNRSHSAAMNRARVKKYRDKSK